MERFNELEFFKERYEKTLEQRKDTIQNFYYFISLYLVLLSSKAYILLNLPNFSDEINLIIGLLFKLTLLISFIFDLKIISLVYHWGGDKEYYIFPNSGWASFLNSIKKNVNDIEKKKLDYIDKSIIKTYIKCAEKNELVNIYKNELLNDKKSSLRQYVIIMFIAYITYFNIMGDNINTQKIKIQDIHKSLNMHFNKQ